jgi:hypothetical protein
VVVGLIMGLIFGILAGQWLRVIVRDEILVIAFRMPIIISIPITIGYPHLT